MTGPYSLGPVLESLDTYCPVPPGWEGTRYTLSLSLRSIRMGLVGPTGSWSLSDGTPGVGRM